jgi:hypothetical protein
LDSSFSHHGLIKLLLVHHLKVLGDYWDAFVTRNGFVTVNPVEVPVVDKPMLEKPLRISSVGPDFLYENPCQRAFPDQSLCEQQDVNSKLIKIPEHEQVFDPNLNIKSTSGNPSK